MIQIFKFTFLNSRIFQKNELKIARCGITFSYVKAKSDKTPLFEYINIYVSIYVKRNLKWFERDYLLTSQDQLKYNKFSKNADK